MFNSLCWYLNGLHLTWLVSGLRFVLWVLVHTIIKRDGEYSAQDDVPGYRGWQGVPFFGVLAFRRTDGTLQFRW